jgi:hypothetical protein
MEPAVIERTKAKVMKSMTVLVGAVALCGFAEIASADMYSSNVQSTNAALSDCVVLNVSGGDQTVESITIYYYDASLHPHVLKQTSAPQTVGPGDAIYVQSNYALPISEGFRVPSTSCTVVTRINGNFRAVLELRDVNGNTVVNDPLN